MMVEAERRAIVWDTVERVAFRPANDKARGDWLNIYANSLANLWETQQGDVRIHREKGGGGIVGFSVPFLDLDCRCSIEGRDKYSVTLCNLSDSSQTAYWHLHVVPSFCSRGGYCDRSGEYPLQYGPQHLKDDVETVLDGMLFHPRNHAHAEVLGIVPQLIRDGVALSACEVRLGGGIENAFAFLTHLRYQFCLVSEDARREERSRLVGLFVECIRSRTVAVPPGRLLNLKR